MILKAYMTPSSLKLGNRGILKSYNAAGFRASTVSKQFHITPSHEELGTRMLNSKTSLEHQTLKPQTVYLEGPGATICATGED